MNIKKQVPNLLTLSRLPLAALTAWLVLMERYDLAVAVFGLGAATDLLDGFLARRWRVESRFGYLADHIVDKIFLLPGLYLIWRHLSLGVVMMVLMTELMVVIFSIAHLLKIHHLARWPNLAGRISFGLIITAGIMIMLDVHWSIGPAWRALVSVILGGSVAFRIISFGWGLNRS